MSLISSRFADDPHAVSSETCNLPCMLTCTHTCTHTLTQVYYLPICPFYNQVTLPVMLTALPLIRDILIREQITILHGHGVYTFPYIAVSEMMVVVVMVVVVMVVVVMVVMVVVVMVVMVMVEGQGYN